jgi:very-short-patch-repair endonuclease
MQPSNRLKKFQKNLRSSQTQAEHLLWYYLRNHHFQGFKFRRQHILQGYIVDFVCLQSRLVIEVDGGQHAERQDYDNYRTEKLQKDGFRVLRFWNHEILTNIEGVLEGIMNELQIR